MKEYSFVKVPLTSVDTFGLSVTGRQRLNVVNLEVETREDAEVYNGGLTGRPIRY